MASPGSLSTSMRWYPQDLEQITLIATETTAAPTPLYRYFSVSVPSRTRSMIIVWTEQYSKKECVLILYGFNFLLIVILNSDYNL